MHAHKRRLGSTAFAIQRLGSVEPILSSRRWCTTLDKVNAVGKTRIRIFCCSASPARFLIIDETTVSLWGASPGGPSHSPVAAGVGSVNATQTADVNRRESSGNGPDSSPTSPPRPEDAPMVELSSVTHTWGAVSFLGRTDPEHHQPPVVTSHHPVEPKVSEVESFFVVCMDFSVHRIDVRTRIAAVNSTLSSTADLPPMELLLHSNLGKVASGFGTSDEGPSPLQPTTITDPYGLGFTLASTRTAIVRLLLTRLQMDCSGQQGSSGVTLLTSNADGAVSRAVPYYTLGICARAPNLLLYGFAVAHPSTDVDPHGSLGESRSNHDQLQVRPTVEVLLLRGERKPPLVAALASPSVVVVAFEGASQLRLWSLSRTESLTLDDSPNLGVLDTFASVYAVAALPLLGRVALGTLSGSIVVVGVPKKPIGDSSKREIPGQRHLAPRLQAHTTQAREATHDPSFGFAVLGSISLPGNCLAKVSHLVPISDVEVAAFTGRGACVVVSIEELAVKWVLKTESLREISYHQLFAEGSSNRIVLYDRQLQRVSLIREAAQAESYALTSTDNPDLELFKEVDAELPPLKIGPDDGIRLPANHPLLRSTFPTVQSLELESHQTDAEFELVRTLGAGGFAEVALARHRYTGRYFALKRVPRPRNRADEEGQLNEVRAFHHETAMIRKLLPHKNVVKYYGVYVSASHYNVVMDVAIGGSLENVMLSTLSSAEDYLSEAFLGNLLLQLLHGLQHLHRHRLIHRDVKPANVLLKGDGTPCWTDFGVSVATDGRTIDRTVIGTRAFAAPEILTKWTVNPTARYSSSADIWSLGAVIHCCITKRQKGMASCDADMAAIASGEYPRLALAHGNRSNPTPGARSAQVTPASGKPPVADSPHRRRAGAESSLLSGRFPVDYSFLQQHYSEGFLKLIDWMMEWNPKQRPRTTMECLEHSFFAPKVHRSAFISSLRVGLEDGSDGQRDGPGESGSVSRYCDSPRARTQLQQNDPETASLAMSVTTTVVQTSRPGWYVENGILVRPVEPTGKSWAPVAELTVFELSTGLFPQRPRPNELSSLTLENPEAKHLALQQSVCRVPPFVRCCEQFCQGLLEAEAASDPPEAKQTATESAVANGTARQQLPPSGPQEALSRRVELFGAPPQDPFAVGRFPDLASIQRRFEDLFLQSLKSRAKQFKASMATPLPPAATQQTSSSGTDPPPPTPMAFAEAINKELRQKLLLFAKRYASHWRDRVELYVQRLLALNPNLKKTNLPFGESVGQSNLDENASFVDSAMSSSGVTSRVILPCGYFVQRSVGKDKDGSSTGTDPDLWDELVVEFLLPTVEPEPIDLDLGPDALSGTLRQVEDAPATPRHETVLASDSQPGTVAGNGREGQALQGAGMANSRSLNHDDAVGRTAQTAGAPSRPIPQAPTQRERICRLSSVAVELSENEIMVTIYGIIDALVWFHHQPCTHFPDRAGRPSPVAGSQHPSKKGNPALGYFAHGDVHETNIYLRRCIVRDVPAQDHAVVKSMTSHSQTFSSEHSDTASGSASVLLDLKSTCFVHHVFEVWLGPPLIPPALDDYRTTAHLTEGKESAEGSTEGSTTVGFLATQQRDLALVLDLVGRLWFDSGLWPTSFPHPRQLLGALWERSLEAQGYSGPFDDGTGGSDPASSRTAD